MFASSPTLAAPDSTTHLATAWYDLHHGVPGASRFNPEVSPHPCWAFYGEVSVNECSTARWVTQIFGPKLPIANYPPPFYWILGVGELGMSVVRPSLEGDGARVLGLVACLAVLLAAAWLLRRANERSAIWSIYLLTPPVAAFLFAGANPNGWEIACALLFTSVLLYQREGIVSGTIGRGGVLSIAGAGLLVATARPISGVWTVLITATFIVWFRVWRSRRSLYRLAIATIPSVAFTLVWNSAFAAKTRSGRGTAFTIHAYFNQLASSWDDLVVKVVQLWGVLGWLDTQASGAAVVGVVLLLLYFLPTYAPSRRHRALLVSITALAFLASAAIEAAGFKLVQDSLVNTWWQGRYSLPIVVGLAMLLFSDPGRQERPGLFALAGWATVFNAYMVCLNFWRYDYGINNGYPYQFSRAAYGATHSLIVYLVVASLLGVSAVLFAANRAQRRDSDAAVSVEPELQIVNERDLAGAGHRLGGGSA